MNTTTRMTLDEMEAETPDVDLAMVHATTDADIERHKLEDGEAPLTGAKARLVVPAAVVRKRLGLSQAAFASLLDVPVGTLRNWEQGRVLPDPAARALLVILFREPEAGVAGGIRTASWRAAFSVAGTGTGFRWRPGANRAAPPSAVLSRHGVAEARAALSLNASPA